MTSCHGLASSSEVGHPGLYVNASQPICATTMSSSGTNSAPFLEYHEPGSMHILPFLRQPFLEQCDLD